VKLQEGVTHAKMYLPRQISKLMKSVLKRLSICLFGSTDK